MRIATEETIATLATDGAICPNWARLPWTQAHSLLICAPIADARWKWSGRKNTVMSRTTLTQRRLTQQEEGNWIDFMGLRYPGVVPLSNFYSADAPNSSAVALQAPLVNLAQTGTMLQIGRMREGVK